MRLLCSSSVGAGRSSGGAIATRIPDRPCAPGRGRCACRDLRPRGGDHFQRLGADGVHGRGSRCDRGGRLRSRRPARHRDGRRRRRPGDGAAQHRRRHVRDVEHRRAPARPAFGRRRRLRPRRAAGSRHRRHRLGPGDRAAQHRRRHVHHVEHAGHRRQPAFGRGRRLRSRRRSGSRHRRRRLRPGDGAAQQRRRDVHDDRVPRRPATVPSRSPSGTSTATDARISPPPTPAQPP